MQKLEEPVFSRAYWRAAAREFKSLRTLVFAALICALSLAVDALFIPVGENLRIMFTFLVFSVGAAVYGPLMALVVGLVGDNLGFILAPSGPWFFGYTLSTMAAGFWYGLILYRRKPTILRLFFSRAVVNLAVNALLGSVWSNILYGKGYLYYLATSLIKNTILLPFEVMLLGALFALLLPAFRRFGMLKGLTAADLKKLRFGENAALLFGLDMLLAGGAAAYFSTTVEAGRVYWILALCFGALGVLLLIWHCIWLLIRLHRERRAAADPAAAGDKKKKALRITAIVAAALAAVSASICLLVVSGKVRDKTDTILSPESAVDIYMANEDVWMPAPAYTPVQGYGYCLLDLDFDGVLELISSSYDGSGINSYNKFYRIDPDKKTVEEFQPESEQSYDGVDYYYMSAESKLLLNESSGKLFYLFQNYGRVSTYEGITAYAESYMENGKLHENYLFSESWHPDYEHNTIDEIREYKFKGENVSKSDFEEKTRAFYQENSDLHLVWQAVPGGEFDKADADTRKQLLLDAYSGFSYDGFSFDTIKTS